jgi:hypothetical protein
MLGVYLYTKLHKKAKKKLALEATYIRSNILFFTRRCAEQISDFHA